MKHAMRIPLRSGGHALTRKNAVIPSRGRAAAGVGGPPHWYLAILLFLSIATSTAPALRAQDTGVESNLPGAGFGPSDASAAATPTIHVYSRETVIDVLALDAKGRPVTGLTRGDFTVEEDGRPQPIRSFREYSVTGPPPTARQLPPHTWTNAQALPAVGPVQIFYFILPPPIPTQNPLPVIELGNNIIRAKQYIADYLRTMPAGTEVAIFAFLPGEGLHLVQGFTADGAHAAAALDALVVQRVRNANPGYSDPIAAADQIAAYVAGIHGRKNLIWVTPGKPLLITRDGGYSDASDAPDMSSVHRLMDTYDRFTQEEIAIYPLDPFGVHGLGMAQLMAQKVADETGGSTSNSNDFKTTVANIVAESSHFYTLSYVPTRPDSDGHFHPITIKIARSGVTLRYRGGYNDEQPRPPDQVLKAHMMQAPMQIGALPTTQLVFDLEVQPTPPSNLAEYTAAEATLKPVNNNDRKALEKSLKGTPYDAVFRFDPTQIAFAEGTDGKRTATMEFDLGAYDTYSNLVVARRQAIKLSLTPAEYDDFMKTTFRFYLPIPLPHGELSLRAGLFDTVANTSGTLEAPLKVAKPVSATK